MVIRFNYLSLDDDFVTIKHNSLLSEKPYQMTIINYNNEEYNMRLDKEDIDRIIQFLDNFKGGR
jgi:hypothetical protein